MADPVDKPESPPKRFKLGRCTSLRDLRRNAWRVTNAMFAKTITTEQAKTALYGIQVMTRIEEVEKIERPLKEALQALRESPDATVPLQLPLHRELNG